MGQGFREKRSDSRVWYKRSFFRLLRLSAMDELHTGKNYFLENKASEIEKKNESNACNKVWEGIYCFAVIQD